MAGPLEGIRVIEWAWALQGPAIGYILGDLGAEVIKIESPVVGDFSRGLGRWLDIDVRLAGGTNVLWETANRSKKSIVLDLSKDQGRQILYRLIGKSDVFVNNFRPSVRRKLGVDYETLSRYNPRLVYATASGCGKEGPDVELRAYDNIGMARAGLMYAVGEPTNGPQQMVFGMADMLGATVTAMAIITALFERERSGSGQEVEGSMLGALIHASALGINVYLLTGQLPEPPVRTRLFNPLVGWYRCADSKWVVFSENQPQEAWPRFCAALGLEELVDQPMYNTTKARGENREGLIGIIGKAISARASQDWLKTFREHDLIFAPVNRFCDLPSDPQVTLNNYIVETDHPSLGKAKMVGFPYQFSRTPARVRNTAPEFGQHTEEVLLDVGGYNWEEIASFREQGVLG